MLDLLMANRPPSMIVVHLYYVQGLTYHEEIIKYHEERYGIEIKRHVHPDVAQLLRGNRKRISPTQAENYLRERYELQFVAYGYRKDESLERRGMLAHLEDGIDWKFKRCYPLIDWSQKHVDLYVKKHRLKLSPEYAWGWRDINSFKGDGIIWIKENYPADYQRIVQRFPMVEGEYLRAVEAV